MTIHRIVSMHEQNADTKDFLGQSSALIELKMFVVHITNEIKKKKKKGSD